MGKLKVSSNSSCPTQGAAPILRSGCASTTSIPTRYSHEPYLGRPPTSPTPLAPPQQHPRTSGPLTRVQATILNEQQVPLRRCEQKQDLRVDDGERAKSVEEQIQAKWEDSRVRKEYMARRMLYLVAKNNNLDTNKTPSPKKTSKPNLKRKTRSQSKDVPMVDSSNSIKTRMRSKSKDMSITTKTKSKSKDMSIANTRKKSKDMSIANNARSKSRDMDIAVSNTRCRSKGLDISVRSASKDMDISDSVASKRQSASPGRSKGSQKKLRSKPSLSSKSTISNIGGSDVSMKSIRSMRSAKQAAGSGSSVGAASTTKRSTSSRMDSISSVGSCTLDSIKKRLRSRPNLLTGTCSSAMSRASMMSISEHGEKTYPPSRQSVSSGAILGKHSDHSPYSLRNM